MVTLPPAGFGSSDIRNAVISGVVGKLYAFGSRNSITTGGNDIWIGSATTIPIPPDIGEQMSLISDSAQDAPGGTGVSEVMIHYLDANGIARTETKTMNGITLVDTVATNIRFVQEIHSNAVGSSGAPVGNITIFKKGSPATIYNQLIVGNNRSWNTTRMVPANKTLYILSFNAANGTGTANAFAVIRLRATVMDGELAPRLFTFLEGISLLNSSVDIDFSIPRVVPAFGIVKATSYTTVAGGNVSASWEGILIDTT